MRSQDANLVSTGFLGPNYLAVKGQMFPNSPVTFFYKTVRKSTIRDFGGEWPALRLLNKSSGLQRTGVVCPSKSPQRTERLVGAIWTATNTNLGTCST